MKKVNLSDKFSLFEGYWEPKVAGELNGQLVKLAKLAPPLFVRLIQMLA